jgi:hypothetical protein
MECHDTLFGPFKLGLVDDKTKSYESILEVMNDRTDKKKQGIEITTLDYHEAARIAYTEVNICENISIVLRVLTT